MTKTITKLNSFYEKIVSVVYLLDKIAMLLSAIILVMKVIEGIRSKLKRRKL